MPLRLLLLLAALGLPLRAQLIAYLPLDGDATDATGHGYNGTVFNATPTAAGHSGGAYFFDGTSSYIELPLDINATAFPQLTMGAWVLPNALNPIRQIISQDDGGLDRSLGLDSRGGVDGWSAFAGTGWVPGETATLAWTFVAVVYDQTAATATLYVNGQAYTFTNATLGTGWSSTRIGMNPSFGEYFSGTIDEVFFFSSALSATELAALRTGGVLAAVPEPSTWALLGLGLGGITLATLRRRKIPPARRHLTPA